MKVKLVTNQIVKWIKERAEIAHSDTLVVGVSGGIDSAVVSVLCAMTGLKTILLELPINKQSRLGEQHVESLIHDYVNSSIERIDLTNAFNEFKKFGFSDLALANVASRLRMVAAYGVANSENGLVVGTGNKIEDFGVGFFTKYGDGGVDISPISDLYKSQVYELGRYLGVSEEILNSVPTDGLWEDGRTDEDQLGYSYDELEWAMKIHEGEMLLNIKTATQRQLEAYDHYYKLHTMRAHKWSPIPVFKLTREMK